MAARKHSLQTGFDRLDDRVTGQVLDSIVVHPHHRGVLYMPGEYSTARRPPAHRVHIISTDTDNDGVYTDERQIGGPDHYRVSYDVWNYRDSVTFADLVLTEVNDAASSSGEQAT